MTREHGSGAPRRAIGVVGVLLALVGLTGCPREADVPDNRDHAVEAGDRYVALGDSYTAAPGVGNDSGPTGCDQTDGNYPHLLAAELELDLVDVSCAGARTDDMAGSQRPVGGEPVPPQLDAVTEDTDLVTLSIGANNGNAFLNLVFRCVALAAGAPDGAPCATFAQANPEAMPEVIESARRGIEETIGEIAERAPKARIVVVGYPQIFPSSGYCELLPLGRGDYAFAQEVLHGFVRAQESAADAAGVEYVDVWGPSEGHDICSDDPWMAGTVPAGAATPYHPYAVEQQAVTDLLVAALTGA